MYQLRLSPFPCQGHKLESLMTEMNTFYNDPENVAGVAEVERGQFFAARHTDGFWYRVKVVNVVGGESLAVRYVDYG